MQYDRGQLPVRKAIVRPYERMLCHRAHTSTRVRTRVYSTLGGSLESVGDVEAEVEAQCATLCRRVGDGELLNLT